MTDTPRLRDAGEYAEKEDGKVITIYVVAIVGATIWAVHTYVGWGKVLMVIITTIAIGLALQWVFPRFMSRVFPQNKAPVYSETLDYAVMDEEDES